VNAGDHWIRGGKEWKKCNSLCKAVNQATSERRLSKDDLKLEVIE